MINSRRVGVVMPAYNAVATLARTVSELDTALVDEVILVDDCSTDDTVSLARGLGLEPIRHDAARGPWPVTLYSALVLIFCCMSTQSLNPRYVLPMVGIFVGYGAKLPTWAFWPALVVSAGVMALLVSYYPTHLHGLAPFPP